MLTVLKSFLKASLRTFQRARRARIGLVLAIALFTLGCSQVYLPAMDTNPWQTVAVPGEATLSDIAFTADRNHGWLVGSRSTLLETTDGGQSWTPRRLELDNPRYTFTSISFDGDEGWIAGQPTLLLHTTDGGQSWSSIELDPKLPGDPFLVTALGSAKAELATDIGAIYLTENGGRNWRALVQGAVGVVRNMNRNEDGRYIAVSSRGNFYSTWDPGQQVWQPHNRENSKRLQNAGFTKDGLLWLIARGGQLQFGQPDADYETWSDPIAPEPATSWGLLDMAYRTADEVWVSGGSGNLLMSPDGGETWVKDRDVEDVPTNFYRIKFLAPERGFILGERGYLLRYAGRPEAAESS
ncbi:photosynthesis system II assembly factor Ycf48 [Romeria aff. gracilis LEGE 07310]|uniref:Photosystem II assembly protein Ycf48 n=1 Tax=Vasconcelosia minhoensis LEGE 07310 TaxID=915328 RepID=A0A8J7AXU1_9CYAN|nr:photosynthesis system II assembly factor Ycf48 [Romeria gracilis]MBE9078087.1 photosynthesis system II assembly factor Ycf48 [Romeria aff. gracilis LEGE 07310]